MLTLSCNVICFAVHWLCNKTIDTHKIAKSAFGISSTLLNEKLDEALSLAGLVETALACMLEVQVSQ
jgi:hypothetical protein